MHMPRDWAVLHDKLDTLIRQGKGGEAQLILEKLQDEKIPREWVARFALVARRADRPQFGLRVLNPIVRADRKLPMQATPEEKAEYAQCLIRLGASEEASLLLEGLSVKKLPQVLLYRASAHLTRWEYAEALPLLKFYVKAKGLTPYQRLVGKVSYKTQQISDGLRELPKQKENRSYVRWPGDVEVSRARGLVVLRRF